MFGHPCPDSLEELSLPLVRYRDPNSILEPNDGMENWPIRPHPFQFLHSNLMGHFGDIQGTQSLEPRELVEAGRQRQRDATELFRLRGS